MRRDFHRGPDFLTPDPPYLFVRVDIGPGVGDSTDGWFNARPEYAVRNRPLERDRREAKGVSSPEGRPMGGDTRPGWRGRGRRGQRAPTPDASALVSSLPLPGTKGPPPSSAPAHSCSDKLLCEALDLGLQPPRATTGHPKTRERTEEPEERGRRRPRSPFAGSGQPGPGGPRALTRTTPAAGG